MKETPQVMTYEEREHLKRHSYDFGDQASEVLIMIAQWMAQVKPVSFTEYASQWADANGKSQEVSKLREAWPLERTREKRIPRHGSEYHFNMFTKKSGRVGMSRDCLLYTSPSPRD